MSRREKEQRVQESFKKDPCPPCIARVKFGTQLDADLVCTQCGKTIRQRWSDK